MKKIITTVIAIVAVLIMGGCAQAQPTAPAYSDSAAESGPTTEFETDEYDHYIREYIAPDGAHYYEIVVRNSKYYETKFLPVLDADGNQVID